MEKSITITNLAKALAKFHTLVPDIKKDATNPFFKSKYAPLDSILPMIKRSLTEAGLAFIQIPVGENQLTTILIHAETGEFIQGTYTMKPTKQDPQGYGSVITYMRRYALVSILGLNTENDDDANTASTPEVKKGKAVREDIIPDSEPF